MPAKPSDTKEYKRWLLDKSGLVSLGPEETYYNMVTGSIRDQVGTSPAWSKLEHLTAQWQDEYRVKTGYELFTVVARPPLYLKPFDSVVDKSFRRNVVNNSLWPEPPSTGWLLPENWLIALKDVLRTMLVVKYLDGVAFILERLKEHFGSLGLSHDISLEARTDGYYAAHIVISPLKVEVPTRTWGTEKCNCHLEIQVTTQLQEVIKKLLHKYYQEKRSVADKEDAVWQWDYKSVEFASAYLGHILHYIEGLIVETRDRSGGKP